MTGHDPDKEPKAVERFCPIRNVTKDYLPTMLLHGTRDDDVPYEQSLQMAGELKRRNVGHVFITIPAGPHGFDDGKKWLKDPANVKLFQRVLDFLKSQTK